MSKKKETKKAEVKQPKVKSTNETFETFVEESAPEKVIYRDLEVKVKDLEPKNNWEIKDRMYYLKGNKKPVSRSVKSSGMYWFDQEKGYERELKYCENQQTCFVDEMQGDQRLSHIIFRRGTPVSYTHLTLPTNREV